MNGYLHSNYSALRLFVRDRMSALKGARLQATYLAWVDATPLGIPSSELARSLGHWAEVKFSPGAIYGEENGAAYLRVNLACPRATLFEALARATDFLGSLA